MAEAFRRRHRAISSKGTQLLGERVIESDQSSQRERIELTYRHRRRTKCPVVRLFVWSDRWAWVDAREAAKTGWRWEWTSEGRIVGTETAKTIVQAFEATIASIGDDLPMISPKLNAIWKPLLAIGPTT